MSKINPAPLILLDDVQFHYNVRQGMFRRKIYTALRDISLSIHQGETLGLIGRNGAGKSTILRLIGGIYSPDKGTVSYNGDITVSLLSLNMGMDAELSGTANAILNAMFLGFSKLQAIEKLQNIIEFAELGNWINEPLRTYSTGMKARLGFAVALEMTPNVLLIDEVLGVGDHHFRKKSMEAMTQKINSDQTIVFVSHSMPQIRELCTRVAWIEQGRLKMIDDTEVVINAYEKAKY